MQTFGADPSVTNCTENTIPARALAIDPTNYSLNFLYSCSTATENLQHPPFGPLHDYYLAHSTDGGLTWTTHKVFAADTSGGKAPNYANIFGTLAIDSGGNYYALFDGTADDKNADTNPYHVYLEVSTDHGQTWSRPIQVDQDAKGAGTHVLAHLAVTTPRDRRAQRCLRNAAEPVALHRFQRQARRLPALHGSERAGLERVPGAVDKRALVEADVQAGGGERHAYPLRRDLHERARLRIVRPLATRLHQRRGRLQRARAHRVRRQHEAAGGRRRCLRPRSEPDRWLGARAARTMRDAGAVTAALGGTPGTRR